jgi:hypothetical protein
MIVLWDEINFSRGESCRDKDPAFLAEKAQVVEQKTMAGSVSWRSSFSSLRCSEIRKGAYGRGQSLSSKFH